MVLNWFLVLRPYSLAYSKLEMRKLTQSQGTTQIRNCFHEIKHRSADRQLIVVNKPFISAVNFGVCSSNDDETLIVEDVETNRTLLQHIELGP